MYPGQPMTMPGAAVEFNTNLTPPSIRSRTNQLAAGLNEAVVKSGLLLASMRGPEPTKGEPAPSKNPTSCLDATVMDCEHSIKLLLGNLDSLNGIVGNP